MKNIQNFDKRRGIIIPGKEEETIDFAVSQFIELAHEAIKDHGFFSVALSGGSTPKAIFKKLSTQENASKIDFSKVLLFWGDERAVDSSDPESNYKMAMDAGFNLLPIPKEHIFPMKGTGDLEANARAYEAEIKSVIADRPFDLVMLGMGDDGHTASLFPHTKALQVKNKLVVANEVPQKNCFRLTLTFDAINAAKHIVIYVIGKNKAAKLAEVLNSPLNQEELPIQAVGTFENKALFVLDEDAASAL